jgi:hypothetical protein
MMTRDAEHFEQILKDEASRLRRRADELDPPPPAAVEPAQGAKTSPVMARIDARLADLREANETYRKSSWDRSDAIQRNEREIHWLREIRSELLLERRTPPASESPPDWKQDQADTSVMPTATRTPAGCERPGVGALADWFYDNGHEFIQSDEEDVARALLDAFDVRLK